MNERRVEVVACLSSASDSDVQTRHTLLNNRVAHAERASACLAAPSLTLQFSRHGSVAPLLAWTTTLWRGEWQRPPPIAPCYDASDGDTECGRRAGSASDRRALACVAHVREHECCEQSTRLCARSGIGAHTLVMTHATDGSQHTRRDFATASSLAAFALQPRTPIHSRDASPSSPSPCVKGCVSLRVLRDVGTSLRVATSRRLRRTR